MKSEIEAFAISTVLIKPFPKSIVITFIPRCTNPVLTSSRYAAKRAIAVSAAEPIAKPFPVAAVVLPTLSRASVLLRTSSGSLHISAFPPALSAIGPKASIARVTPKVASIPTAPKPIPYNPNSGIVKPLLTLKAAMIAIPIMITGAAVDFIPTANPSMITVAGPYSPCLAIPLVGE